jgi:hypothetical protein
MGGTIRTENIKDVVHRPQPGRTGSGSGLSAPSVLCDLKGRVRMPASVEFDTTVAAAGNNTGIVVPDDAIERLGAGRRPAVVVNVNGYEYRNTVAVMGGKHMISISAAVRKETGLKGGDPIHVTLTVADTPREVDVPGDFASALSADTQAKTFFEKLSNSLQRYHVDTINAAKTTATRQRRIEKAISLFREGKQR